MQVIIAIDPGQSNGVAIFEQNAENNGYYLKELKTLSFWDLINFITVVFDVGGVLFLVEDANLNKPVFSKDMSLYQVIKKAQSVGAVKRETSLLIEYLKMDNLPFEQIRPLRGAKDTARKRAFIIDTGIERSNQHVRDAYFIGRAYITQILKSKIQNNDQENS